MPAATKRGPILVAVAGAAAAGAIALLALHARPGRDETLRIATAKMRQASADLAAAAQKGDRAAEGQARARLRDAEQGLEQLEHQPGTPAR